MAMTHTTESEQAALWNGRSGQTWVDLQESLDRMFQPLEDLLLETVLVGSPRRVLDVGCGTGSTTLAAARVLGPGGQGVGIDISGPMTALARRRAEQANAPASFLCADAQDYPFEPASFDLIMSRFGVMFFGDFVKAFANLRRAAAEGAELRCIVWRSPSENAFMTMAEQAAAPLLPKIPPRNPDGPGPFALADRDKVQRILEESGWSEIDIRAVDFPCALPRQELVRYLTRLGPLGQVLPEVDEPTRTKVIEAVRAAFEPYVQGEEARFTAACWVVGARAITPSIVPPAAPPRSPGGSDPTSRPAPPR